MKSSPWCIQINVDIDYTNQQIMTYGQALAREKWSYIRHLSVVHSDFFRNNICLKRKRAECWAMLYAYNVDNPLLAKGTQKYSVSNKEARTGLN